MSAGWCGYIDLLATRSVARRGPQDLLEALDKFHSALVDAFRLHPHLEFYAFSDGAFFVCPEFSDFFEFYQIVRNQLFEQGLFFRCSFLPGSIDVKRRDPKSIKIKSSPGRTFFSMTFTGQAPRAYQRESDFKGVGCTISFSDGDNPHRDKTVSSYFLTYEGNKIHIRPVVDFVFHESELSRPSIGGVYSPGHRPLFDQIISSCHRTLSKSEKIASYYVPALVTAIRSVRFDLIDFDEDVGWTNAPYIFEELILGGITRALRQLPGLHLVLLTCFDHLYNERQKIDRGIPHQVERAVLRRLMKFPNCFKNLDQVPDVVISEAARARLIDLKVSDERSKRIPLSGSRSNERRKEQVRTGRR